MTVSGTGSSLVSTIDPSCVDPNATILLKTLYPLPITGFNVEGLNFTSSDPDTTRWREQSIRLDYNLTEKWRWFARFTQDNVTLLEPLRALWPERPSQSDGVDSGFPHLQLGEPSNLYSQAEFHFGVPVGLYYASDRRLEHTSGFRSQAPDLNIPELFPGNNQNRIPSLNFSQGYAPIVLVWPFHNLAFTRLFEFHNTWVRGQHTVKFGFELSIEWEE